MCVVWRFFNLPCLRMSPVCVRLWVFFSQVICVFLSWTIFISWVFCFLVCRHAFSVVASALVCHGQFLCCVFNNSRTRLGFPVRGRWFCEWLFSLGFIWRWLPSGFVGICSSRGYGSMPIMHNWCLASWSTNAVNAMASGDQLDVIDFQHPRKMWFRWYLRCMSTVIETHHAEPLDVIDFQKHHTMRFRRHLRCMQT